ncbi:hypothetical protein [Helicobacter sp. 16-1353]|uniref:hypothetical protein n=1 Tax=Helicobacter sp. 16-1353 TaxID=2004996 RepID=UPI0015EF104C|nr:hypothetical protein [Helicobacter sp. 16-1353]
MRANLSFDKENVFYRNFASLVLQETSLRLFSKTYNIASYKTNRSEFPSYSVNLV